MKISLRLGAVLTILLVSTAMSAQPGSPDDLQTPQRTAPLPQVEPTPGQRVCQRQAQIITRDNFVAVINPKVVDEWKVDWSVFQDTSTSIDDPARTQMMRCLNNRLTTLSRTNFDEEFMNFVGRFDTIRRQIEAVHGLRLDTVAMAYFSQFFSPDSLSYQPKKDGVQLGERIIVNQGQSNEIIYHVKTHSAGRLSSNSTAAKMINPQELLAYRTLEHLGIGCETHFFQRSAEDVYIATLDAGTGGHFSVFTNVTGGQYIQPDEALGKRVVGTLMDISNDPRQLNFETIENNTSHDPIAQNFVQQMAQLDSVTRVLRLHDLLNNPDNWGFVESKQEYPAIRVIDFRVIDDPQLTMNNENWGSFLEGNGLYQYAGSHKTLRYVIHDRPRSSRVETVRRIFDTGLRQNFQKAVRLAYRDTLDYINHPMFQAKFDSLRQSLDIYYKAIQDNIEFFTNKLRDWNPPNEKRERAEEFGIRQRPAQPKSE